ncbi:MAG: hypothetical protein KKD35_02405 [Elusimicrobia bacterium]|nr:hypothetical protein [Elusimicrobiota bacterium]
MTEEKFVLLLEKKLKNNNLLTRREVGVGYGIADLVLFKLNPTKCKIRNDHKQYKKIENENAFKIFEFLPESGEKKKADVEYLSKELKISKKSLKYKYLKQLLDDKFVKVVNDKYYFKVNGWMPIAKEVIAVEAKLKDWKRGIIQANRYKSFANKTYLAMPLQQEKNIDKKLLEKHNIGLMLFDADTGKLKTKNPKREKALNKFKANLATESILNYKVLCNFSA